MLKSYLIDLYIKVFEKCYHNKEKRFKIWNKIKENTTLLEHSILINDSQFNSLTIVYMILTDKTLYTSEIYNKLVNKIYSNITLARTKFKDTTLLMLILENEELILTKDQKLFLIFEAENSPFSAKYYENKSKYTIGFHGSGILDIRYKILKNKNFTLQEKKNLFFLFYADDEIKISILEELLWEISTKLDFKTTDKIDIKELDLSKIKTDEKRKELLEKIELYNEAKKLIPEPVIKKYINND